MHAQILNGLVQQITDTPGDMVRLALLRQHRGKADYLSVTDPLRDPGSLFDIAKPNGIRRAQIVYVNKRSVARLITKMAQIASDSHQQLWLVTHALEIDPDWPLNDRCSAALVSGPKGSAVALDQIFSGLVSRQDTKILHIWTQAQALRVLKPPEY